MLGDVGALNRKLMNIETIQKFAEQGFSRVPVMRTVMADLDTPVSAYAKLAAGKYSYLFESVQGGETWGRYSIIGLPCKTLLRVFGNDISIEHDGQIVESFSDEDPLNVVEEFQARYRVPQPSQLSTLKDLAALPEFFGGLVGYFAYDTVRYVEPKLKDSTPKDTLGTPDILLMVSEEVLVFDNLSGRIHVIAHVNCEQDADIAEQLKQASDRIDTLEKKLFTVNAELPPMVIDVDYDDLALQESDFSTEISQPDYFNTVEKIKEYALAGDIMQVVPSRRMSVDYTAPPISLYRALRTLNPSPYMYFLDMDDFHIVGSSPEILARAENGEIFVRPIAGTRRRGYTPDEDKALEEELLADEKEIAEHLMLIDLGRNDAGRVAKTGSVEVTEQMVVERYSHVMHIVSNVKADLKEGLSAIDVIRATLPAGTLSGAPKVRAMEIIDEVEPVKRGVYGGAIGYISWSGNMDTAIAIRTAVIKDKVLHVQAGGGVVADSIPKLEWKETSNKARAMMRAAAIAAHSAELSVDMNGDLSNGGEA